MIKRGAVPSDGFTIVPNAWLRDPRLTAKAKGLLAYFLSHAEGYVLTIGQIQREMRDGEDAIRTGIKELEKHDYLTKTRQRDESGRLGAYEWVLGILPGEDQPGFSSLADPAWETPPPKKTTEENTTKSPSASQRGHRLPEDWTPSEALLTWFVTELVPGERWSPQSRSACRREHAKFMDHWKAASGQTARKRDWEAAWRNWMRRAFERRSPDAPVSAPPAGGPKLFETMREERTAQRKVRSEIIDELLPKLQAAHPEMSISQAVRKAAELADAHLAHLKDHPQQLNSSSATGYIEGDVIDTDAPKEVTGDAA